MPQRTKPGVDWAEIERAIRAGESSTSLAKIHDVKRQSIDKRANKQGWRDGPQKWMPALANSKTVRRLESPQTAADKAIVTQGNRTAENAAAILANLEKGMGITQASEAAGIVYETFKAWRKDDQVFDRLVWQARHSMLGDMQGEIVSAARRGDWKAADRVLATAPETRKEWASNASSGTGITVNISIGGEDTPPIVDITPTPEDK